MTSGLPPRLKGTVLILVIVLQAACAAFFLLDALEDFRAGGVGMLWDAYIAMEAAAALSLGIAIAIEAGQLRRLLQREAQMLRGLGVASGALQDLIESYFAEWGLTPSEQDVATFTIKGFGIAEIARFRGSAEGTVKAHLNAIYRKSGTTGRAALVSLLIEDLMRAPLIGAGAHSAVENPRRIS